VSALPFWLSLAATLYALVSSSGKVPLWPAVFVLGLAFLLQAGVR